MIKCFLDDNIIVWHDDSPNRNVNRVPKEQFIHYHLCSYVLLEDCQNRAQKSGISKAPTMLSDCTSEPKTYHSSRFGHSPSSQMLILSRSPKSLSTRIIRLAMNYRLLEVLVFKSVLAIKLNSSLIKIFLGAVKQSFHFSFDTPFKRSINKRKIEKKYVKSQNNRNKSPYPAAQLPVSLTSRSHKFFGSLVVKVVIIIEGSETISNFSDCTTV